MIEGECSNFELMTKKWSRRKVSESIVKEILGRNRIDYKGERELYLAKHIYEITPYINMDFKSYINEFESRYTESEVRLMAKVWSLREKVD